MQMPLAWIKQDLAPEGLIAYPNQTHCLIEQ
jgi:hypothetical protein